MEYNLKFETVGGHTFAPELLSDGCVIDVGCRGWEFSDRFKGKTGRIVYSIDPDPSVFHSDNPHFFNPHQHLILAISDKKGDGFIYLNESCPEGTCLKEVDPDQNHSFTPCKTITMDDLYEITGTNVDVLKLDCEGAEYIILGETFEPIPKQITIEWHKHTVPEMHDRLYPSCKERLMKDYVMIDEIMEPRHGCGENIWDQLWIRKDLL